jgi:hypothetical protein
MYPHAVQFETRRLQLGQWIELNRDRRQARRRAETAERLKQSFSTVRERLDFQSCAVRTPSPDLHPTNPPARAARPPLHDLTTKLDSFHPHH